MLTLAGIYVFFSDDAIKYKTVWQYAFLSAVVAPETVCASLIILLNIINVVTITYVIQ